MSDGRSEKESATAAAVRACVALAVLASSQAAFGCVGGREDHADVVGAVSTYSRRGTALQRVGSLCSPAVR